MIDRLKVMMGLECCKKSMSNDDPFARCQECPYNDNGIDVEDCRSVLSGDCKELLEADEVEIRALKLARNIEHGIGVIVNG